MHFAEFLFFFSRSLLHQHNTLSRLPCKLWKILQKFRLTIIFLIFFHHEKLNFIFSFLKFINNFWAKQYYVHGVYTRALALTLRERERKNIGIGVLCLLAKVSYRKKKKISFTKKPLFLIFLSWLFETTQKKKRIDCMNLFSSGLCVIRVLFSECEMRKKLGIFKMIL